MSLHRFISSYHEFAAHLHAESAPALEAGAQEAGQKQCGGVAGPGAPCKLGAACVDGVWPGGEGACTTPLKCYRQNKFYWYAHCAAWPCDAMGGASPNDCKLHPPGWHVSHSRHGEHPNLPACVAIQQSTLRCARHVLVCAQLRLLPFASGSSFYICDVLLTKFLCSNERRQCRAQPF